jgi:response regulator NasT
MRRTTMLRVMLVDDASHEEAEALEDSLRALGFEVAVAAPDARSLLDRVGELAPDVIIIASESPTRDTLEQLAFVTERRPRPIVLFTEDRANATIAAALRAGVSAYIVDGVDRERLRPILDVAIARFEQERALRAELRDAKDRLADRKVIERAKGVLMREKGVGEDEAFALMRKLAMDRNRRLADIAQQILDVTDLIG